MALLSRLHFYLGVFIGPFILLAAVSGTLYVLTPQLENRLYAHLLFTNTPGTPQTLEQQIYAAQRIVGFQTPIIAVRPASGEGHSTRIMFSDPTLKPGENRALFINPVSLDVLGESRVYGTSGILPLRMTISYLHSGTLFGSFGRYYSELAASWLWLAALGGLALRVAHKRKNKNGRPRRHASLGTQLLPLLLFFSATGLTWSQLAGENIAQVRQWLDWRTPALNTALDKTASPVDAHQHHSHHGSDAKTMRNPWPGLFDGILLQAQLNGIEADKLEIRPSLDANHAWTVSEIDRSWPTRINAVAIDPASFKILDRLEFERFPLIAKLIRWGIDAHMGVLFGVVNQLLLALFGVGLCTMIVWGYLMWWRRRPTRVNNVPSLVALWRTLPIGISVSLVIFTAACAVLIPLFGVGLILMLLADSLINRKKR
ncbi:MAG TPA: hypothetical protein DHV72_08525 [Serratia grimesii]|uniref:PepSY-associated TM helix n=2 Tax=Serratia grimesii TaxID=82995 RepID=A0A9C7QWD4_9GAMM|nr:hypothetical protein [Serratia grimesii]